MEKDTKMEEKREAREYIAFISYRHKDTDKYVAKRIHTLIERYVIPKELLRTKEHGDTDVFGKGADAESKKREDEKLKNHRKLGLVFRDEEELPVSSNLTQSIQLALDHTQFLIVVCTPNTPESIWVEREIAYFLQSHDRSHVIGVLADGTPDESFPKLLTTIYDEDGTTPIGSVEPLAANLTDNAHHFDKRRIKKEAVRLYAALLGCPFDSLWQREKRHKMKMGMALMALGMTIALSFSLSIYLKNLQINAKNHQIEEQNAQIQEQNAEIKEQYDQIQEKNSELRRNEAETLIREAELLYDRGEMDKAAKAAVRAISTSEGKDNFAADAEYLLNRALGAGQYDNVMRTVGVIEQDRNIVDMLVSKESARVFTMDDRGNVRCFSTRDGSLLWTGDALSKTYHSYTADRRRMREWLEKGILLCQNEEGITALALEDGHLVWNYALAISNGVDFACQTPDGQKMALIKTDGLLENKKTLVILNLEDGTVLQEISLEEAYPEKRVKAHGRECGAFSEDGRYLAGVLYGVKNFFDADSRSVFLADLQTGTVKILYEETVEMEYIDSRPFVIGMTMQEKEKKLLLLHYDTEQSSVRMDEIFWDGKVGEQSAVTVTIPARSLYRPYYSTYAPSRENGYILASCGEMALIYRMSDGSLAAAKKYSAANILSSLWLDEKSLTRSLLTDDGTQYCFYEQAGYTIASCIDKIHIVQLCITEDYAINHGGYGHVLDSGAVFVAVCEDNLQKAYIMKPAKDAQASEVEWFDREGLSQGSTSYKVTSISDDVLLYMYKEKDKLSIRFVQGSTQKVLCQYELTDDELPEHVATYTIEAGQFWQDCRHVTILMEADRQGILDLQEKKLIPVFGDDYIFESQAARGKSGELLHAGIAPTDENDLKDHTGILLVRLPDGEVRRVENTGTKKWIMPTYWRDAYLKVGGNGYALWGQYLENESEENAYYTGEDYKNESFGFYDSVSGSLGEIADECQGGKERLLVMGEEKPIFATADEDNYLRIYDMEKKTVVRKFILPVICSEVQDILLCKADQVVAVWSLDRRLYLYDTESGKLLFEGIFEKDARSGSIVETIKCIEDPAHQRLYFVADEQNAICINTKYWKKTADFCGLDAYCPATNEIYVMKYHNLTFREEQEGILRCLARTLEELEQLVK